MPLSDFRSWLFLEELVLDPQRHGHAERGEALRRGREVGFEQALELQKRLVVEDDFVDTAEIAAGRVQAIVDRIFREGGVMLLAREAFFLRSRNDAAVLDEGGRTVVIKR